MVHVLRVTRVLLLRRTLQRRHPYIPSLSPPRAPPHRGPTSHSLVLTLSLSREPQRHTFALLRERGLSLSLLSLLPLFSLSLSLSFPLSLSPSLTTFLSLSVSRAFLHLPGGIRAREQIGLFMTDIKFIYDPGNNPKP
jgi:hypothetical protein